MSEASQEGFYLSPGSKIGSYLIVRCIGEGGMGTVYEGLHEGLGKRVAIKTLHARDGRSDELIGRFMREGRAAARIQHPNVVDVVDVGVHDGTAFMIMEFLQGEDLGAMLARDPPMQVTQIADLMVPIISALSAVHDVGIVHRDLKPDNIFITLNKSGERVPKLVDFGISKLDGGDALNLTGTNAILGTPYYMSPEQAASSKNVDYRSDIFSLGVILYQCASHQLPFDADSLFALLTQIVRAEPPSLRSVSPNVPAEFETVVSRAMQREPAERYQSAAALGAALLPLASPRIRLSYEREFGQPLPAIADLQGGTSGGASLEPVNAYIPAAPKPWRGGLLVVGAVAAALALLAVVALRMQTQPSSSAGSVAATALHGPAPSDPRLANAISPEVNAATSAPTAIISVDGGTAMSSPDLNKRAALREAITAPTPGSSVRVRGTALKATKHSARQAQPDEAAAGAHRSVESAPPAPPRSVTAADDDLFRDRK